MLSDLPHFICFVTVDSLSVFFTTQIFMTDSKEDLLSFMLIYEFPALDWVLLSNEGN